MELNPNHPVTRTMAGQWHKIVALLMVKFGQSHIEISVDEITKALAGDMKAVTIRERDNAIVLELVSMKEAERLAREEGGLPA
jgi:hypothetical protein